MGNLRSKDRETSHCERCDKEGSISAERVPCKNKTILDRLHFKENE
jgi:hypothetical protein